MGHNVMARAHAMAAACAATVAIRLHAVRIYGRVIHEVCARASRHPRCVPRSSRRPTTGALVAAQYDPWFNFRATEHLVEHGSGAFSRWYDERSWYPLGRPVGATVYPALMYTARLAHAACAALGFAVSLNDVCVFLPAYGAVLTVCFVALLAYEASHSADAAIAAAWIAALIPAHAMRSVAGAYDNEAVAMPAIVCALWLWARSLRTPRAWPIALGAGAACGYVAAAWGAYPLVFNLVALHVGILLLLGRYTRSLHVAYACLWCAGTLYAASVPIVGRASFRSAEQLAPILAHGALAIAPALEAAIRTRARTAASAARMRCAALVVGLVACACAATVLNSLGALTPLSVRVRALFVAHAKTGNPLVDSVAEHRTTSRVAFVTYVHAGCVLAPIGAVLSLARWTDASLLLVAYLATTWFLSSSMVRLLVLVAPPVAAASGIALAALGGWAWRQLAAAWRAGSLALGPASSNFAPDEPDLFSPDWAASELEGVRHLARAVANALVQGGLRAAYAVLADWHDAQTPEQHATSARAASPAGTVGRRAAFVRSATWSQLQPGGDLAPLRPIAATSLLVCGATLCGVFAIHSAHVATRLSEPIIVTRFRMHGAIAGSSRLVIADDYREAYGWLRERSAPDARVLAWWDYGARAPPPKAPRPPTPCPVLRCSGRRARGHRAGPWAPRAI